jgi:hypothetical protein
VATTDINHYPIDSITSNGLFLSTLRVSGMIPILYFTTLQTGTWNTFLSALDECRGDGSYSLEATLEPPCPLALRAEDGRRLKEEPEERKGYVS